MRKVLITFAVLFSFYFINLKQVEASSNNLLDLQNLHGSIESLETINAIEVQEGALYTLVFSSRFSYKIDTEGNNNSESEIKLVFGDDIIENFFWEFKIIDGTWTYYKEFTALSGELHIKNIHFDGNSPEASLVKGSIFSFRGFYLYNEQYTTYFNDEITYEQVDNYRAEVYYYNLDLSPYPRGVTLILHDLEKSLGEFEITYMAIENNKKYYCTIFVNVIDDLPPVLLTNTISYEMTKKPDLEQVLSDLSIVDNTTEINRSHIEVVEDDFSEATMPGTYNLKIKINDDSNNVTEETVSISLISDGKVTLEGPMTHFYYKSQTLPSIEEIIEKYKATDPYDGSELEIEVTHTSYTNVNVTPGNKTISISVKDSSGAIHKWVLQVIIIDDYRPGFAYNNIGIRLDKNKEYSNEEMIDIIGKKLDDKGVVHSKLSVVKDELDENKLNITYIDENEELVYDYVTIDYYSSDKTTLVLVVAIGLVAVITATYFIVNTNKKKKKLKR